MGEYESQPGDLEGQPRGLQGQLEGLEGVLNIEEMRILKVYKLHMLGRTLGEVIWLHRMTLNCILLVAFLRQYANEILIKIPIIEILSLIEVLA